ncbi:hypothetical protein ACFQL5_02330 [Aquipuribacter hungaricus]|uniref:Uncharacterized protein n=1 Tax=Aquipuribacter hungaricus TaxID=545624 RepID=A0ABV7WCB5_9MICO
MTTRPAGPLAAPGVLPVRRRARRTAPAAVALTAAVLSSALLGAGPTPARTGDVLAGPDLTSAAPAAVTSDATDGRSAATSASAATPDRPLPRTPGATARPPAPAPAADPAPVAGPAPAPADAAVDVPADAPADAPTARTDPAAEVPDPAAAPGSPPAPPAVGPETSPAPPQAPELPQAPVAAPGPPAAPVTPADPAAWPEPVETDPVLAAATAEDFLRPAAPVAGARTSLPLPRASWTAPVLTDPYVWRPSATDRVLKNVGDRDVLVVWPETPLDVNGGFQINGGGDIVSIGGVIQPSRRYFEPMTPAPNNNRCLYIGGSTEQKAPRTIHIEGLHCAGPNVWEGINIDSKGERGSLTVQMRDVRIDRVNVDLPGGVGNHYGGDALQTWNGPHRLLLDGFTAKDLHYQGLFLQPYAFGSGALGQWELRNVQLQAAGTGSAYLLWLADSSSTPLSYGVEGMFVQPSPGDTRKYTIWHSTTDFTQAVIGAPAEDLVGYEDVGVYAGR